ncbi:hypothetical protein [Sanguibacter sp. Z1732]
MNREIMDARTEETSERGDVGVVPVRTTAGVTIGFRGWPWSP